jgi:hypothetical protein
LLPRTQALHTHPAPTHARGGAWEGEGLLPLVPMRLLQRIKAFQRDFSLTSPRKKWYYYLLIKLMLTLKVKCDQNSLKGKLYELVMPVSD